MVLVKNFDCKQKAADHEFDVIYNGYMNEETDKFEGPGICTIPNEQNLTFVGEWKDSAL